MAVHILGAVKTHRDILAFVESKGEDMVLQYRK